MLLRWYRSRVIEECVQLALEYRDELDAHVETLDANGHEPSGAFTMGDPNWSLGGGFAANMIAIRLRRFKL